MLLARYRAYTLCDALPRARASRRRRCGSASADGRSPSSRTCRFGDLRIFLDGLALSPPEEARLASVVAELRARVRYMNDVGLDYLTLSRAARTLSGGEAQRIGLASALGGALTGTLYVLDEPTIGLHAVDTRRLLAILRRLADRGNTVVVVEHDPEAIEAADHVIDLGPDAGSRGGQVLFAGNARARSRASRTRRRASCCAAARSRRRRPSARRPRRSRRARPRSRASSRSAAPRARSRSSARGSTTCRT